MKKFSTFLFSFVPMLLAIGLQFVAVFYLMFLSAVFVFGVAPSINGKTYSFTHLMDMWSDLNFNTIAMIVFSIFCVALFGIWYYKSCGGDFRLNLKKTVHPLQIIGIILLVPGTQFLSSILVSMISTIFPSWLEAYESLLENAGINENISALMLIYSVCLAPISEELIFRGVTLRIARRAFPFWVANIIQAALFGAFHMNVLQACYAFALGLVLGYVCEHGGSIYYTIFFHFLFNLWGTTASTWLNTENEMLAGAIVIFGTFVGLGLGLPLFNRGTKLKSL